MSKTMLIDAGHPEETRVVMLNKGTVEDFDFESTARKQLRGNIYLAKVTRVEPSLQAAFVEYGGNRHGFLAFNEIHPDYYQIPVADREALLKEEAEAAKAEEEQLENSLNSDEEQEDELPQRPRRNRSRQYKIQEVIKRRQVMLIQVVKEERGGKGAALTTYMSLAGRYCVLMPNTARGGGISRKISNASDRKRLKGVVDGLDVADGMGLIIRTAGAKKTKTEIKRDFDYLMKTWGELRDRTLKSIAPALIYEEETLVKRSIRDMYDKDVDAIHVQGDEAYRECKDFVKTLMPSHAKKVQHYKDPMPLYAAHNVENQLQAIHSPNVPLKSGGYLVINQTEALVAIDVNSGKATRERNIETTATKTNLEAAEEAARQMRLRDLAGLVVIDFIDMEDNKHVRSVEKRLKDSLKHDRARLQVGKMSMFGLMEMSRQRRRTGVLESTTQPCDHCQGVGRIRNVESTALNVLRTLEAEAMNREGIISANVSAPVAIYILNEKREHLKIIEDRHDVIIKVVIADTQTDADYTITGDGPVKQDGSQDKPLLQDAIKQDSDTTTEDGPKRKRRRRRRRRGGDNSETENNTDTANAADAENNQDDKPDDKPKSKGRGRRRGKSGDTDANAQPVTAPADPETQKVAAADNPLDVLDVQQVEFSNAAAMPDFMPADDPQAEAKADKPKRKPRKAKADDMVADKDKDEDKAKPKSKAKSKAKPKSTKAADSDTSDDVKSDDGTKAEKKTDKDKKPKKAAAKKKPADKPAEPVIEVVGGNDEAADKPKRGGWWQKRADAILKK